MDLSSLTSKHHTINQPSPPTATVAGDIPSIGQPFTGLTPLYKPHNQAAALGGNPSTAALAGDTEAEVGEEAGKQGCPFQIQINPATCLANAPDRRYAQAIPARGTESSDPRAIGTARVTARFSYAPAPENQDDGQNVPNPITMPVLPSNVPLSHNQGRKLVDELNVAFNHRFRVEAKVFAISVTNLGIVKMTEWGSKISNAISMERFGARSMVNMVDKLRVTSKHEDFVSRFNESSRAFLAQCCANRRGRYLMIAQFGDRRRKGVVMVPEGANGEGWASISWVFQAVVDSFVAGDKAKRRLVNECNRQGLTYAKITANLHAPNLPMLIAFDIFEPHSVILTMPRLVTEIANTFASIRKR